MTIVSRRPQRRGRQWTLPRDPVGKPLPKFNQTRLRRHFAALLDDLEHAMREISGGDYGQRQLMVSLERLFRSALKLDSSRLTYKDGDDLTAALYASLPKLIADCCSDAYVEEDWDEVWEMHSLDFDVVQGKVMAIVLKQADPDYLAEQARELGDLSEEAEEIEAQEAVLAFPKLASLSPEIDEAVQQLAQAWQEASVLPVSIEDQFLLGQIAEHYLLDTWQMLSAYHRMPQELRESAQSMVLDQLRILSHQVGEIHVKAASTSLTNLRVQTEFIRAQHEQRQASGIALRPS